MRKDIKIVLETIWYLVLPVFINRAVKPLALAMGI